MPRYSSMTKEQMKEQLEILTWEYNSFREMGLSLDMSRGKPCAAQLDLSNELNQMLNDGFSSRDGIDTRNYGVLEGLSEMRDTFSAILGVPSENVLVGGAASLSLMYDTISRAMTHGVANSEKPWGKYERVKFLCPVPGYDRHFSITQHFGIDMINIPMSDEGPDMDAVEALVRDDDAVKGMWCVPVYSNPGGAIYSDEVIKRLASMRCAAPDFTLMWDNAYCVHHLYGTEPDVRNILDACTEAGNPDRVILFASTSKITFAGSGVSCFAGSEHTIESCRKAWFAQTISYDKRNQLAHARFLKDIDTINAHMAKHAALLRPKFKAVDDIFTENLDGLEIASWTKPLGGYFINLVTPKGTARRIVQLCTDANVKLTPAGAAFPYGNDPDDSNIRIAPSFPTEEEIRKAAQLMCVCVRVAALEKLLDAQE